MDNNLKAIYSRMKYRNKKPLQYSFKQFCNKVRKEHLEVFNTWVKSRFDRKLTPSVDRKDSNKGYEKLSNVRIICLYENTLKSNKKFSKNDASFMMLQNVSDILMLYSRDELKLSGAAIGRIFNIDRSGVHRIFERIDKNKPQRGK